jgi:hypothetical protein
VGYTACIDYVGFPDLKRATSKVSGVETLLAAEKSDVSFDRARRIPDTSTLTGRSTLTLIL